MSSPSSLNVLVLRGGPDRERPVSLKSGAQVAAALRDAGHRVREADILPDDLSALDGFAAWPGDVVFPVLHGRWGEGGALQRILAQRNLAFVGSAAPAAELCIDKHLTKLALAQHDIATPAFELLGPGRRPTLTPPVVVKVPDEGSSFGLAICHDQPALDHAIADLRQFAPSLLVEQFVKGDELTVGIVAGDPTPGVPDPGPVALPPIHIVPATAFYDYDAKYDRDDTQYRFDLPRKSPPRDGAPAEALADTLQAIAIQAYQALGCRHLARIDFMLDAAGKPWCIEVNTMPGFTTHSLLPMAARHAGLDMPQLTDRLARLAAAGG